jgi:flagellar basal body-associated protein FliL
MAKKKKAAPADDGEEEKKGRDPKMMAVGGLIVAGLVYQFALKPAPADPTMDGETAGVTTTVAPVEGEIYELPEMVLNLNDPDVTYLRIAVALVLEEGVVAKDFEAESAIAKDILVQKLTQLSAADLDDPVRRQEVKDELGMEIRAAYGDAKVVRVLITSLVMQ